jgi:hypothetical protein
MNNKVAKNTTFRMPQAGQTIELGQWYWYTDKKDGKNYFCCVMKIGSNFIELHTPHCQKSGYAHVRVHIDEFDDVCKLENNPDVVIQSNQDLHRERIKSLMSEVIQITQGLGIQKTSIAENNDNSTALVRLNRETDVNHYKQALIKAKNEELPELQKKIKKENEELVRWMSAEVTPLIAQTNSLTEVTEQISGRIFNVELYAGLTEEVVEIVKGKPATIQDKLHVMQRRCYMDEECLANYDVGGMSIEEIGDFDKWLSRPENMDTVLPFPKCMVVFRVRRTSKDYPKDLNFFIKIQLDEGNKRTFIYIRNGENLYRISTALEFDHKIFPNTSEFEPTRLLAHVVNGRVQEFITEHEYEVAKKELAEVKAKHEEWCKENPNESTIFSPWRNKIYDNKAVIEYQPFNRSSLYYDEMTKEIQKDIQKYNRISLIIQGLFDRSMILHPHNPVQLWDMAGFNNAVTLVYDVDRALYECEKPDFEAYRRKCNQSIKVGSVTVGQQVIWEEKEADKEYERQCKDYRIRNARHMGRYKPYGNPGPGYIAEVVRYMPRVNRCTFEWERERKGSFYNNDKIKSSITISTDDILNIDAYQPGDYKKFFADPRTRAEYLKWAPLLLTAEDYYAGKRNLRKKN